MQNEFICIEGNIGIGKTTLVKKLSGQTGQFAFYEEFEENPWLPLFYEDPENTVLSLELSFLTDRIKQLNKIKKEHGGKALLNDYCLDKCLLFAKVNLSASEFEQYKNLHRRVSQHVIQPTLVVVIHSTVGNLLQNIKTRGRAYEQKMEATYLEKLNTSYYEFFKEEKSYRVLNIFSAQLDDAAYERIFREIIAYLKMNSAIKNTSIEL